MKEQTTSPVDARRNGSALYGLFVLALAVCMLGNLLIRIGLRAGWMPAWAGATIALASVVPLALAAVWFWRMLRRDLDELAQRVVLEGLAFALIVYVPLAGAYLNLRAAGVYVPRLDPPDILLAPAILTAIGIAIAWRKYQ
jgi:hypothetical protein